MEFKRNYGIEELPIILLCLFLLVGCGNKKNYEINITLKGEDSSYKWEYQGNIDKTFELKKEEQITNDDNTKTYQVTIKFEK